MDKSKSIGLVGGADSGKHAAHIVLAKQHLGGKDMTLDYLDRARNELSLSDKTYGIYNYSGTATFDMPGLRPAPGLQDRKRAANRAERKRKNRHKKSGR